MGEDSPHNKRKRVGDEQGERDPKKVLTESRRLGIDNLHLDVGEKYLLCRTPLPPPRSQMSEDLFEIYGLTGLATEVARVLPNGEKNALRKTYKGHMKKLGIQGQFDSVKEAWERPDSLLHLAKYSLEDWNCHFVKGKDIVHGLTPEVKARLPRACTMNTGLIPKSLWDSSVLGDLSTAKGEKQPPSARPTAPNTPVPFSATAPRAKVATAVSAADANGPRGRVKQSCYGDSSFEGYGEGYPDDDGGVETGYSTGEGDMGSGLKRRKKSHPVGSQSYVQPRQPGYGLSMSGV